MAWNPSPKVASARDIGKKFGKPIVIVMMIDGETVEYASYGASKNLCDVADDLGKIALDALLKHWKD